MAKHSNQLAIIRGICDGMQGKNYGFNDCAAYVMEAWKSRITTTGFLPD